MKFMAVAPEQYRKVLSKFATGVTIITLKNAEDVHGLTVNAFCSVSLEPPLILICIQKNGVSHSALSHCEHFVVNILSANQSELADRFADSNLSSAERFLAAAYRTSRFGVPILNDTLGYLECRIVNEIDAGDHTIFLGEVEQAEVCEVSAGPLLFYESRYHRLF